MRILIDIGHPAHVHYFRNFIKVMQKKGHDLLITARNKEVCFKLLKAYDIDFESRDSGARSLAGKLFYLFKADWLLFQSARRFRPDLLMGFGSPYAAQVSFLIKKPCIIFDDTEIAFWGHLSYRPFANTILTPASFRKNMGKRHIRFNGFMELCSLHPDYFKPDKSVYEDLGIPEGERFVVIRFVSWNASHDVGHKGLNYKAKVEIVRQLSEKVKVFISSEYELSGELKKYHLMIPPEKMQSLLFFATLLFGESGTMTSECAMLGTPAIQISGLPYGTIGTLTEQEQYGLIKVYEKYDESAMNKAFEIINNHSIKSELQPKLNRMLSDKIDVTAFMVWFIENYPKSLISMKSNPAFQTEFN